MVCFKGAFHEMIRQGAYLGVGKLLPAAEGLCQKLVLVKVLVQKDLIDPSR